MGWRSGTAMARGSMTRGGPSTEIKFHYPIATCMHHIIIYHKVHNSFWMKQMRKK